MSDQNYSLCRTVDKNIILKNLMKWRNEQKDMLRNPKELTWADQERYWQMLIAEDSKRYGNTIWMQPLTLDKEMIGWCGLTNIDWGIGFVIKAEPSFIVATERALNPAIYEEDLIYFLTEIKEIFFNNGYWKGHKLYAEGYDLPDRQHHLAIFEKNGFKREGILRQHVMRNKVYVDSIMYGMLKEDL